MRSKMNILLNALTSLALVFSPLAVAHTGEALTGGLNQLLHGILHLLRLPPVAAFGLLVACGLALTVSIHKFYQVRAATEKLD